MVAFNREEYRLIRGSDVIRDGMYLELARADEPGAPLAEYFYSDSDGQLTLTVYAGQLPQELLIWFRHEALQLLTPS